MADLTPDDLARMRPQIAVEAERFPDQFRVHRALADALEAAWAELDQERKSRFVAYRIADEARRERDEAYIAASGSDELRERAERAEKRCDELRPWAARWVREGQIAVEALARVRTLCDGCPAHDYLEVARIRAAIEGDNQ